MGATHVRARWRSRADDVRLRDFACVRAGIEQLPLPLGDDFDGATDHFDRGLVVDCVRRDRQTGRPELRGGHRLVWRRLVVQVREHREVDEAQRSVVTGGDWAPRDKPVPDLWSHHQAAGADSHPDHSRKCKSDFGFFTLTVFIQRPPTLNKSLSDDVPRQRLLPRHTSRATFGYFSIAVFPAGPDLPVGPPEEAQSLSDDTWVPYRLVLSNMPSTQPSRSPIAAASPPPMRTPETVGITTACPAACREIRRAPRPWSGSSRGTSGDR